MRTRGIAGLQAIQCVSLCLEDFHRAKLSIRKTDYKQTAHMRHPQSTGAARSLKVCGKRGGRNLNHKPIFNCGIGPDGGARPDMTGTFEEVRIGAPEAVVGISEGKKRKKSKDTAGRR